MVIIPSKGPRIMIIVHHRRRRRRRRRRSLRRSLRIHILNPLVILVIAYSRTPQKAWGGED